MTYSCGIFESPAIHHARRVHRQARPHLSQARSEAAPSPRWRSARDGAVSRCMPRGITAAASPPRPSRRRSTIYATQRIADAGLNDRITAAAHRTTATLSQGRFDRLASIEMIEAVGHAVPAHVLRAVRTPAEVGRIRCCCRRSPCPTGGTLDYRQSAWTSSRSYVFPGSCCPSITAMAGAVRHSAATSAHLVISRIYRPTTLGPCAHGETRFHTNLDARAGELGYDESFIRLWSYYLRYCEAGLRRTLHRCSPDAAYQAAGRCMQPLLPAIAG
jgi:hypothetical protein